MNASVFHLPLHRVTDPDAAGVADWYRARHRGAAGVALWVFIAVATSLFGLFLTAYLMRMDGSDWSTIALPWQLWLSSAWLVASSVLLQWAVWAARQSRWGQARGLLLAGGVCALTFLAVQLWAWQVLLNLQVMPAGNPAASFFYLLTAMHGLHVLGGLVGWVWTARVTWRHADPLWVRWLMALCARYWHFLLAVWLLLFATLAGLTPQVVRYLCGSG
ncbi:MAG: bb3-type cytochrome oxidase subunit III [Leptothrix sp. (in: b-proteobacteria)]